MTLPIISVYMTLSGPFFITYFLTYTKSSHCDSGFPFTI